MKSRVKYFAVVVSAVCGILTHQAMAQSDNSGNCTVDWNGVFQRIDGFGASSAFSGRTWTAAQADLFFSTNTGIGLSLLRNQIQPPATTNAVAFASTSEIGIMKLAQARGARIWSAPWSPPIFCKNTNTLNGGSYVGTGDGYTNLLYARELAGYVANMNKTYGVSIFAISIQNEPDFTAAYPSCLWSALQYHDFVTNLYNALVASNVASTKIMLPEESIWQTTYYTNALNDPNVAADVGIIADHNYDGTNFVTGSTTPPAALPNYGKALWETEVSSFDTFNGSITNAMYWATRIHLFLTVAQANAWHFWWLISANPDNEGLTDTSGNPAKRMYVLGQFSRFVRPGFYRINANNATSALVSAYEETNSGSFAIVAVNTNPAAINQTFTLTNFPAVASVTPWITSANLSLASQTAIPVANAAFSYTLPALSVVTFVGRAVWNTPPVFVPVAGRTINPGVTLVVTNAAVDTDSPPPALTFSLLHAPTNATLATANSTNGIFTWRPLVSQANTTNLVSVQVTEQGTPSLSATNNFKVTVNPLSRETLNSIRISNGITTLVAGGTLGPDYTLLTSTDLVNWRVLFTTNSPALPVTLVVTNSVANAVGFYRIKIGP